jgi:hypothetical protein
MESVPIIGNPSFGVNLKMDKPKARRPLAGSGRSRVKIWVHRGSGIIDIRGRATLIENFIAVGIVQASVGSKINITVVGRPASLKFAFCRLLGGIRIRGIVTGKN